MYYMWSIITSGLGFIFLSINIYFLMQDYKWILTTNRKFTYLGYNWLLIILSLGLFILGISSIFMVNSQLK
ncbi:hypothetical protein [Enterococcus ratti]|uniref:hypothetical protein n=1 Tax=Enterococcus ratti TaxID=150033 RepID=UPI0008FFE4F7|nr:hypothetical protein [Enterococcus ratti]